MVDLPFFPAHASGLRLNENHCAIGGFDCSASTWSRQGL